VEDRTSFPAELRSAAQARHHAERVLSRWGLDAILDVARLLVSELVVNAVTHAGSSADLSLCVVGPRLRVEVSDQSPVAPQPKEYSPTAPDGRGLLILDDLADAWGVDVAQSGKTVWFELVIPGDPRHDGVRPQIQPSS
jgi:anti-sigma regulatory factor (Ser/Thr protein kinase)